MTQQSTPPEAAALSEADIESLIPVLASGVQLRGEMPAVGFTTAQWLIERDGQFLQVSELLYRVAQEVDGSRTVGEIAAAVTATSEYGLEPLHVHYLIQKKLQPLGLVLLPSDVPHVPVRPVSESSPLRLKMRMRMFPQPFVDRMTAVLQYAYAPGLLIAIAALIGYAHWWLYSGEDVRTGVERSLYEPGAMGVILLLTVAAGLFHELGHSSALRYGGGRPRGIGFGLYLMFPAFYSDVTDSYRLGRLARIRTDLGGIYFHLIFAAGLIGLAAWTGNQFLIAASLLFNVEAVRQLIPLVRLDGYWLLADLTGVPDFMSQVRVFAHSVRSSATETVALPQFKPWVTVAFGLYLLLSIPMTLYFIALMVMYLPDLWVLTQRALVVQTELWWDAGAVTRFLIAIQIALLPVPVLALTYFLYTTVESVGTQLGARFGWSGTAVPVRRLAGATTFAAVAAFAVASWAPDGPQSGLALQASSRADAPDPAALLQRAQEATLRVHTLEADLTGALGEEVLTGRLTLRRPNQARVEVNGAAESLGTFSVVSDGSKLFAVFPRDNSYTESEVKDDGSNINAFLVDQVKTFFKPERLSPANGQRLRYLGREQIDGAGYDVVEMRGRATDEATRRYYISLADHLVHGVAVIPRSRGTTSRVVHLRNLRTNSTVEMARFQWTPPPDATSLTLESLGITVPIPGVKK